MNENPDLTNFNDIIKKGSPETGKFSRHLIEGVSPIMTRLGTHEELGILREDSYLKAHLVKYNNDKENREKEFFRTENARCVISKIDNLNKFSLDFYRCTGLVVAGIEKGAGKNISFLSHQDPNFFLYDQKSDFESYLVKSLTEIKERCIPGTIDAVVAGGTYPPDFPEDQKNYIDSIHLLSNLVQQSLGFEPIIVNGPKKSALRVDNMFYNTEERRLTLIRPNVNSDIGSFTASDMEK